MQFRGYADDTQLYVTFKPDAAASKSKTRKWKKQEIEKSALNKLERCIVAIRNWMAINWLKLNNDRNEFIVLGSNPNVSKVKTHSITTDEHKKGDQIRSATSGQFFMQMPKWRAMLLKHVRQLGFIFLPLVKSVGI